MVNAVVFCMSQRGHFSRLLPIIEGLVRSGATVHVYTDRLFRSEIEALGAVAVDLYAGHSIDEADSVSQPNPCRYISFAGEYAEDIAAEVRPLSPSIVLYDTFAYVGFVVARILDLPAVNVCAGHNQHPGRIPEQRQTFPVIDVGPACLKAVDRLKAHYGIDADPFAFLTALSSQLNIYCEPEGFLPAVDRHWFEPVTFFGSVSERHIARLKECDSAPVLTGSATAKKLRLYVSFGTVIWRFFPDQARAAMRVIVRAVADMPELSAVVSLGNSPPGEVVRAELHGDNIEVQSYVDQWGVLSDTDVFITHNGLNSTHEAIVSGVPMISYPFFADQPHMARTCEELGIAIPLAAALREPLKVEMVKSALQGYLEHRDEMLARLAVIREWELAAIAGRGQVVEQILALANPSSIPRNSPASP